MINRRGFLGAALAGIASAVLRPFRGLVSRLATDEHDLALAAQDVAALCQVTSAEALGHLGRCILDDTWMVYTWGDGLPGTVLLVGSRPETPHRVEVVGRIDNIGMGDPDDW